MFPELDLKEGWSTVILLILMLLCVTWAMNAARWTDGLIILQEVVVAAGLTGIILGKSRTRSRLAHVLSGLMGFTLGVYLTSTVVREAATLTGQGAILELEWRFRLWLYSLITQEPASSRYMFLLVMSLVMWFVAYYSAWAIFRRQQAWWAVILTGLALLVNVTAAKRSLTGYFLAFLIIALLLIVRTSLASYQQEWRRSRVRYGDDLVGSSLRAGLIISVVAIVLAWLAPEALASRPLRQAWDRVSEPWRRIQEESSRMFPDLNYQNQPPVIRYSRAMRFGGPVELTDAPVADVRADGGRYWRFAAFHEYNGNGWTNTDVTTLLLEAGEEGVAQPEFRARHELSQTVVLLQDMGVDGVLLAAAQPIQVSLPVRAVMGYLTPEEERGLTPADAMFPGGPGDPTLLYPREPQVQGATYGVLSSVTHADEVSLRLSGTDYPDWIVPRYTVLPESVPGRVRLLAEEVTADAATPYDKAIALRDYLRGFPYNEAIAAPEPWQDGVDYFLFEAQEGYCTYYASAMVVMLRLVGVPARYVEGYSNGSPESGVYHLLEWDGHSWVEVFFPHYGWVEFEPTAADPINARPLRETGAGGLGDDSAGRDGRQEDMSDPAEELYDPDVDLARPDASRAGFWYRARRWLWPLVGALALALGSLGVYATRRRRQTEGMSATERVYFDLVNWVRRLLGIRPLAHQTPHEYARSVSWLIPRGRQSIERLADAYVAERFGGKAGDPSDVETAWREVWPMLWQRWAVRLRDGAIRAWRRVVPSRTEAPPWQTKSRYRERSPR